MKTNLAEMSLSEALGLATLTFPAETIAALTVFKTQDWVDLEGIDRAFALKDKGIPLPESKSYAVLAEEIDTALETLGVEVDVKVEMEVKVSLPAVPTNAYAHLLSMGESASGLSSAALAPRIKPDFIKAASKAVLAYVLTGTGVLSVLGAPDFWQDMMLEDLDLRRAIDNWLRKAEHEEYITDESSEALFDGVKKLFGPRFDKVMATVAKFSAQTTSLSLMGAQAIVDVGEDAPAFAGLADILPLLAEEVGTNMIASRMPEHASRHIEMVADLMAILKNSTLHAYGGVVGATTPDEGAVMFLSKRLGPNVANKVRLALAYEAVVAALAECPSPMVPDYLKIFGVLASRLNNLFQIVQPNQEEAVPAPFRRPVGAVGHTEARIGFSLNLSITWRR